MKPALPRLKPCMDGMMSGAASVMRSLTAPSTTPTITPASSSRRVCCTPRASCSVSSTANTAPTKAAPVRPSLASHTVAGATPNKARAEATPSDAPEALPSRNGSASGLRNSPCATAPARPSKAPASQAPRLRGRRMSHTMRAAKGSSARRSTLSKPVLPTLAPSPASSTESTIKPSNSKAARWRAVAMPAWAAARCAAEGMADSLMAGPPLAWFGGPSCR